MALINDSLMTNAAKHLLICLSAISVSSLPTVTIGLIFFVLSCKSNL